jgi:hypothetical protein
MASRPVDTHLIALSGWGQDKGAPRTEVGPSWDVPDPALGAKAIKRGALLHDPAKSVAATAFSATSADRFLHAHT